MKSPKKNNPEGDSHKIMVNQFSYLRKVVLENSWNNSEIPVKKHEIFPDSITGKITERKIQS